MFEMAPETVKKCKENLDGRWVSIGQGVRHGKSKPLGRPSDVVYQASNVVANARQWSTLSSPSLLVSGQMASHHFDQISRF